MHHSCVCDRATAKFEKPTNQPNKQKIFKYLALVSCCLITKRCHCNASCIPASNLGWKKGSSFLVGKVLFNHVLLSQATVQLYSTGWQYTTIWGNRIMTRKNRGMIHTDYVSSTNVKIIIFKYSKSNTYISFYICLAEHNYTKGVKLC